MRTSALLILSVIIAAGNSFKAQETTDKTTSREAKRKIVPGIKAGVNRSNVYDASGEAFAADRKRGYAAGIFVALPLGGLFGIQPEVVLQQKGFEGTGAMLGDRYVISRTTTHIDIPIQGQLKLFKWFTFLLGPQFSFLMKQTDSYNFEGNTAAQTQEFQNEDLRNATLGTITGIDLNFGHLVLSGRSGWDLNESHKAGSTVTPRYRNMWLQGTIGYRFY
jgi:hypothetical protein